MKKYILISSCLFILTGCNRSFYIETITKTYSAKRENLQSGACDIAVQLDRCAILLAGPSNENIYAGFRTGWCPGSPPFACDRLHRWDVKGVFRFDLSSINLDSLRMARLEIIGFEPQEGGIEIHDAPVWDANLNTTTPGLIRRNAQFQIRTVTSPWAVESSTATHPNLNLTFTDLHISERGNNFQVPFTSALSYDVTHEIRQMTNGGNVFGFLIQHNDIPAYGMKSSNKSYGMFRVRLAVNYIDRRN